VGEAAGGVDVLVQVVDAKARVGRGDAYVFERQVGGRGVPAVCAVNKVDLLRTHLEVPQLQAAADLGAFEEIVPVSARTGRGLDLLLDLIVARLPEGPPLYPSEMVTDQPLEVRLAELVREQALAVTREEVPHSIAVVVEDLEQDHDLLRVTATIVLERDSQKGIVIGKGGSVLKAVGTGAREEIERLVGGRVYLDLRVKVLKEWQRDPKALRRLGF
jgi:GTP-binding protein Era